MNDLEERSARLEARLHDGFTKIGEMMATNTNVENWEARWCELLREYETIEDILREERAAMQPEQSVMPGMPRAEVAA